MAVAKPGIPIDVDLHRAVKTEAAALGVRVQDAYGEALRAWTRAKRGLKDTEQLTPEERRLAAVLPRFLREGDPGVAEIIRFALQNFLRAKPTRSAKA
jgi:hypothetical protein